MQLHMDYGFMTLVQYANNPFVVPTRHGNDR